jgi:uncharacterized protein
MTLPVQVLVLAKEPVAGRVKTRLCPPLTPAQAADVAAAALADTLDAVRATDVSRRVLVVEGDLHAAGFDRVVQRGAGLDERLAAAFDDVDPGRPALLIGMDTPQVTAALLTTAAHALLAGDDVLGLAVDGGWWALGLREPDGSLLRGVPTSRGDTGDRQLARLTSAGRPVRLLPTLTDVDTADDALTVAAEATPGRFTATVTALLHPRSVVPAPLG